MGHHGFVLTGLEHGVLRNTYRVNESACDYSSSCLAAALRKASAHAGLLCSIQEIIALLMDFVQYSPVTCYKPAESSLHWCVEHVYSRLQ